MILWGILTTQLGVKMVRTVSFQLYNGVKVDIFGQSTGFEV